MDFGAALKHLRDQQKLARRGWNGQGMWVCLSPGFRLPAGRVFASAIQDEIKKSGRDGLFQEYIMFRTVAGTFVPWVVSHTDLLADDWEIVA